MTPQRAARDAVLASVAGVVTSIWAHAECALYGSCATGLDLPSSDVDVVVRGLGFVPEPLPGMRSPNAAAAAAAFAPPPPLPSIAGGQRRPAVLPVVAPATTAAKGGGPGENNNSNISTPSTSHNKAQHQATTARSTSPASSRSGKEPPILVAGNAFDEGMPAGQPPRSNHKGRRRKGDAAAAAAAAAVAADARHHSQQLAASAPAYTPPLYSAYGAPVAASSRDSEAAESDYALADSVEDSEEFQDDGSAFGDACSTPAAKTSAASTAATYGTGGGSSRADSDYDADDASVSGGLNLDQPTASFLAELEESTHLLINNNKGVSGDVAQSTLRDTKDTATTAPEDEQQHSSVVEERRGLPTNNTSNRRHPKAAENEEAFPTTRTAMPVQQTFASAYPQPPYLQMPPARIPPSYAAQPQGHNLTAPAFVPQQRLGRAATPTRVEAGMLARQPYLRSPTPPATAPAGVVVCLKALAAALSAQPWVKELKAIETASIPVIKLLADPALLDPPAPLPPIVRPTTNRRRPPQNHKSSSPKAKANGTHHPDNDADKAGPGDSTSTSECCCEGVLWGGAVGRSDVGLLAVDISFEAPNHGGLASSRYALETMTRWPEAAPLMLVLKELLVQRGLNEPFTGGLSSYSLLNLVLATLLQAGVAPLDPPAPFANRLDNGGLVCRTPSLASRIRDCAALGVDDKDDEDALGYLLTFFLDFFGRQFDPTTQAISILRGDAGLLLLPPTYDDGQWVTPVIEDPLEPTRNVARSCFGIAQIQYVFAHCLSLLEIKGTAAALRDEEVLPLMLSY